MTRLRELDFPRPPGRGPSPPTPSEVWEEDDPANCLVDDWIFFSSAKRERGREKEGGREGERERERDYTCLFQCLWFSINSVNFLCVHKTLI